MATMKSSRKNVSFQIVASTPAVAFATFLLVGVASGPAMAASISLADQQIQVIDHDEYSLDYITVSNRSAFYFQEGGTAYALTVYGYPDAWLDFSGGLLRQNLILYGNVEANVSGGTITYNIYAYNRSTHWSGGTIRGSILARSVGEFYIYGSGFAVDGVPVGYGALTAVSGTLTGTFHSGESIRVEFRQGEASPDLNTGSIILVDGDPTPSPPPDYSDQIALFDDGETHVIDHADFLDLPYGVSVRSPIAPTTVNIVSGAEIGDGIQFSGPSVVNMFGGAAATQHSSSSSALNASDGTFNMYGGRFDGWVIMRRGFVNLSGGTIGGNLWIE